MPTPGLLFALFSLSLWDIYLPSFGVRPLDIFVLILIGLRVVWSLTTGKEHIVKSNVLVIYCFLGFLCIGYGAVGLVNFADNLKPVFAVIIGCLVFCFFHYIKVSRQAIVYCTSAIILVHTCYFLLQISYFYIFGDVLNLYGGLGLEPRALSSIFRPTGLYLEPASYSVSMLMLLALRMILLGKPDPLFFLTLITVLLSLSIWGIVASLVFLYIALRTSPRLTLFAFLCPALFVILFVDNDLIVSVYNSFFAARVENFGSDNSAVDRYGGLSNLMNLSWRTIFGLGISNEYHVFGSSGLSFIFAAGGFVGLIIFLSLFVLLNRGSNLFLKLALLTIFLTAAPIWNTLFWWSWLALFIKARPYFDSHRFGSAF